MKKHLTFLLSIISFTVINAQSFSCGTDENYRKLLAKYPEIATSRENLETFTKWYSEHKNELQISRSGNFIVPVVFHILHDGGKEYLSDNTIFTEMVHFNQYFSKTFPELPSVVATFQPIVADIGIEFRLAGLDPQGNCTNGIDRIYTYATNMGNNNTKLNPWPREKYLNIWVCKSVERDSSSVGTIAYSMYPSDVQNYVNNDIIDGIQTKYVAIGVNSGGLRPVIAHETGHWLNLIHTWGGNNQPGQGCTGDDQVDDTPPTKGQASGCSTGVVECGNTGPSNVQNIMNYADCHCMFTEGQKTRMLAALQSTVSSRSNIYSAANLAATGVDPQTTCLPAPKAEYGINRRFVCVGDVLHFTDYTSNTPQWDRTWTFPSDAVGANTTDSSQLVSFTSPGWKEVTLISTNASGTSTKTKSAVYVADGGNQVPYPYFESFDDPSVTQSWIGINYDNNQTLFSHRPNLGHHSNGCFGLNDYDTKYEGDRDELISPAFDFTGISNSDFRFSFDYSMATRFVEDIADTNVVLEISVSTTCGNTWKRINAINASKLLNAGFIVSPYSPGQSDDYWRRATIDLSPFAQYKTSNVRFKFSINSIKNGNNFYFDNFNLGNSTLGIIETDLGLSTELFPNPTSGKTTLVINAAKQGNFGVELTDLVGNKIMDVFTGKIDTEKQIDISTESLSSGLYLIQIRTDGKTIQKKLAKL